MEAVKCLIVEDGVIHRMLRSPVCLTAFPFLRQYVALLKPTGCGGCRRKAANKSIDFTAIKRALAAMPAALQSRLLDILGTPAVRLVFRDMTGKIIKITIARKK